MNKKKIKIAGIIGVIAVVSTIIAYQENTRSTHPSIPATIPVIPLTPIECHMINDTLPDPKCTPGAIDPAVTQDNIDSTICVWIYKNSKTTRFSNRTTKTREHEVL